jgi:ceramide glucosyltransferase
VSTGFRWYLPGAGFVSQLRAAWDTSIAMMLGEHDHNFAWGGSMAIRTADFQQLAVAKRYWSNTVSDDYSLTRAVREAGGRIHFEPRCLMASHENSSFGDFMRWANRQIIITRVYATHLWRMGLAAYVFYCGTVLFGIALLILPGAMAGRIWVAGTLLVIAMLGIVKGFMRSVVASELFQEDSHLLKRYGARYWQLAPLVPWVMLANFLVAGLTRRIEWRNTHYGLKSGDEVQVLRRTFP